MQTKLPRPGPRYEALIQLLRTAETLWNASRVFFARWDLSPSQFNVLNLIWDQPAGLTQIELSRQLLMHRSNVTGLIDRLEERGVVARQDTPDDRRAYRIVLTEPGRRLMREILPFYYQAAEQVWGSRSARGARELVEGLTQVSEQAQRMAAELGRSPTNP